MEENLGQEPRQQDDTQHAWSYCEREEMLAKGGGDVGGCLHDQPERHQTNLLIKEKTESSNTTCEKPRAMRDREWSLGKTSGKMQVKGLTK